MAYNMLGQLGIEPMGPLDTGVDLNAAMARNAQMRQSQQAQKPQGGFFRPGGTFSNVLGAIGDALLVHSGRNAVYGPQMAQQRERREMGQALTNYLGQGDEALAAIMQANPEMGLALYKMKNPGQAEVPGIVREAQYYNSHPEQQDDIAKYLKMRFPQQYQPGAPIMLGTNDTIEMPSNGGGDDTAPTATGPNGEKVRYNSQSGQWEPMGGPTASPSATFRP